MRTRRTRLATVTIATALTLSACGSTDSGETGSAESAATEGGGGSFSMAVTDPDLLIPGRQSVAFDFAMTVWAPLTFLELDGELTYMQAESVESEDQQTWTVTLRDGWTFHDGSPVTAQDYVDTWNTVAYGPHAFENSGQLAAIQGYDDLNPADGEPTTEEMSGLTVVDDLTFEVELEGPDSQFPLQLSQAQTALYPMPSESLEDLDAYNTHPIGNGPFELVDDYVEDEPFVVTAYGDYAGEAPTTGQITFVPYTDNVTAYTDALAGNVDVASLPTSRMTQAADDFGDQVYAFEAPGISFLGLPLWDERYDDVRVRQAISMAIDRETINEVIYGGQYEPATAFTPAIEPGTPEGICGQYCEYRPDEAAALLEEAGGFEGTMEITYPGGGGLDEFYNAIANNLRQNLGVDAVATPTADWAEFLEARTDEGIDGPFFSRWGALYPSQQATMRELFLATGGCTNCVPSYPEDVAEAIAAADAAPDDGGESYAAVQELIVEDFPSPPLFFETYGYVTSDKVDELVTSPIGNPRLTHIVLAD